MTETLIEALTPPGAAARRSPGRGRTALVAVLSILGIVAGAVSIAWTPVESWLNTNGVRRTPIRDDGVGWIGSFGLRLDSVASAQTVVGPYDEWTVPDGFTAWIVTIAIVGLPPEEDDGSYPEGEISGSADLLVHADDGNAYSQPSYLPSGLTSEGSLMYLPSELGSFEQIVVMADGVRPVTVDVVPRYPSNPYWSFPVPES
ncbi:hypothetical protein [Miniimonas sp. S16]|uniref:hypothetical protein n=1 Tax=Miniimonas sp. S16 TaxID=2171623 RepID=UPI000D525B81|nr:hypothetical protein [Miniimonas sp. S16]